MAGIAAGDDAPNFQSTSIADGIRYVFAVADELGRPAVVNLSLGGHADAHDGSDDLSAVIDQESGAGRIVVAAARNEGGAGLHAESVIAGGGTEAFPVAVQPGWSGQSPPWVVLNCWYDGAQPCEVQIRTSTGETTPWQPVFAGGSPTRTYALVGGVICVTTSPAATNPNGDHQAWIELLPPAGSSHVQGGTWGARRSGRRGDGAEALESRRQARIDLLVSHPSASLARLR